jgi:hypothetical protein
MRASKIEIMIQGKQKLICDRGKVQLLPPHPSPPSLWKQHGLTENLISAQQYQLQISGI